MRRTSVQALGAIGPVIVAVFGRTAIDATITSPATVPAGFAIVSDPDVTAADDADRNVITETTGVFVGVLVRVGVLVGVKVGVLVGVFVRVGVGVKVAVAVGVGVFVGAGAGLSARMCALPTSACALATAVNAPVGPAMACVAKLLSIDSPATLGTARVAVSNASVIPPGGVHVAELANACDVTSIALATVVVTLGAACERPLTVLTPASMSIGATVSTPMNDWIPPTAPVFAEIVHV
jgi:hypothetical protein